MCSVLLYRSSYNTSVRSGIRLADLNSTVEAGFWERKLEGFRRCFWETEKKRHLWRWKITRLSEARTQGLYHYSSDHFRRVFVPQHKKIHPKLSSNLGIAGIHHRRQDATDSRKDSTEGQWKIQWLHEGLSPWSLQEDLDKPPHRKRSRHPWGFGWWKYPRIDQEADQESNRTVRRLWRDRESVEG